MPRIGVQLYTVRDALAQDFKGTLESIARLGFQGVEFAGNYGGMQPAELKDDLARLGLEAAAFHVMIETLEANLTEQINLAKALGTPYLVCPWLHESRYASSERWRETFSVLDRLANACAASDTVLAYHNHIFEFEHRVGTEFALDALFASAPRLQAELDVAWAHAGGMGSVGYVEQYANARRLPLIHLKDLQRDGTGWRTVELGRGEVPVGSVLDTVRDLGDRVKWVLVEQDHCPGDPLESLRVSAEFLREHGWL
jgi:sugar phosphate isomerase/epimerase